MKEKTYRKLYRTLAVLLAILVLLASLFSVLLILCYTVEFTARILPSYEKEDLSEVLGKEIWNEEDYRFLYLQTGLGKSALDELRAANTDILPYQEEFFREGVIGHDMAAVTTPHDRVTDGSFLLAPLHEGDIIVSSACHTLGWRNGHAALIVNGAAGRTIESFSPDRRSGYGTVSWFTNSSNFMVLRLKAEYRETIDPAAVAADASVRLMGVDYSIFVGFFYPKDQCENDSQITVTHCSHLVWQAYKNFGIDIDSNGGPLVTAQDIANSEYFEVVQVNGFDPVRLWK